jgi:ribosomal-protein-alanine N-acetyltransferase
MPALIRRATLADVDAMLAIEQAASTAAHWSRGQYQAIFHPDGPSRLVLLAESGRICGFLLAQTAGPEWELENLVVAPDHQRRGVGRELVQALLRHARQQHALAVLLEVRASNGAAQALYQACGFVRDGLRPRYYLNPQEDAILYRCHLVDSPARS